MNDQGLYAALVERGMTRRSFLKFSTAMAAALALPATYAPRIAQAVVTAPRLPVIWVRGQTCGGNTEGFLRASDPSVSTMLLETLSVEYHQSLLATAGAAAELTRTAAMARYPDGYIAVVEGAIPDGASGAYCLVGGRPVRDVVREVCDGALATIAVGSCAFDGGIAAANGALTDAKGIRSLAGSAPLITLPGCPMNVVNLTSVIVHYLTFREWPALDPMGRPLSAYGNLIHNQCERRPHFEFGEFALAWGDEGAQRGWCLYKLGCKGPEAMGNCPTARYGDGVSWNIRAGHGCVGCVVPDFWDQMGPAYRRLPAPIPFFPNITTDMVGAAMVGGIGAVAGVHAVGMGVRFKRRGRIARREALAAAEGVAVAEAVEVLPVDAEPMGMDSTVTGTDPTVTGTDPTAPGTVVSAPVADASAPDPETPEGDGPTGTEER
jgi:hydrogenase small subunit